MGCVMQRRGILFISPDYRNFPQGQVPDMVLDVTEAIKWAVAHAHELGGDSSNISVIGQSAGAHLAAMCLIQAAEAEVEAEEAAAAGLEAPATAPRAPAPAPAPAPEECASEAQLAGEGAVKRDWGDWGGGGSRSGGGGGGHRRNCSVHLEPNCHRGELVAGLCVSSYYYTCVLILLCMCPHTTIHVSSYYYPCVLILLYMCPHTTVHVFSYYCMHGCLHTAYMCVRILLYVCPHTTIHMGELVLAFGEGGGVGTQERGAQGGEEGEERGERLRQWGVGLSPRSVRLFVGISGPYNIVALAVQVAEGRIGSLRVHTLVA
jgi:hypothetical protein